MSAPIKKLFLIFFCHNEFFMTFFHTQKDEEAEALLGMLFSLILLRLIKLNIFLSLEDFRRVSPKLSS